MVYFVLGSFYSLLYLIFVISPAFVSHTLSIIPSNLTLQGTVREFFFDTVYSGQVQTVRLWPVEYTDGPSVNLRDSFILICNFQPNPDQIKNFPKERSVLDLAFGSIYGKSSL